MTDNYGYWNPVSVFVTYTGYHVYAEHEALMDIIGVANLAVTTQLDKALTKDNPAAYLCGIVKREIRTYCFYHSRLIPIKNHHMPSADVPTIVSLDVSSVQLCHVTPLGRLYQTNHLKLTVPNGSSFIRHSTNYLIVTGK